MKAPSSLLAATTLQLLFGWSSAILTDQVNPTDLDYGTFQNPSSRLRPRFRYWVPDASVDVAQVQADIADAKRVGAGGVELVGYYDYGDIERGAHIIPSDWTQYGWGTAAWRTLQDGALQATKDNDMIIDLPFGPNQAAGVPAPADSEGLQWDVQPFNTTTPIGGSFQGELPGWGTGTLISASTGLVKEIRNVTSSSTDVLSGITTEIWSLHKVLEASTLQDVTAKVDTDGSLNITFPSNSTGEYFVTFAYYLIQTGWREQQTPALVIPGAGYSESQITSYVQNGSFVVDHFSKKGAQLVAEFWNDHLLNGSNTAELVQEVGGYVWEDSQEYPFILSWTPALPETFETGHQYSLNIYMPVFFPGSSTDSGTIVYVTDETDSGQSRLDDYRQTVTELNAEYLQGLTDFAASIGVQSSAQVVYNMNMDMLANIPEVNAPECESLGFSHSIDSYRQFAGPANLAGKRVISSECGAEFLQAYQSFVPNILWDINRSFVGGVNAFVLHGYPFTGYYPNTTWPTWSTFFFVFSEMHNRHQPGWDFYKDGFMDYTARTMFVTQSGVPKVDLVFYHKVLDYRIAATAYSPSDLETAGYTYEYLSPDDFSLATAYVDNGRLAPTRQDFKAIIVRANDTLTPLGISKLSDWANLGFPVIFSGGIPTLGSGTSLLAGNVSVDQILSQMTTLPNVHSVPYDDLSTSLALLGIRPRAAISDSETPVSAWYTRWRENNSTESNVLVYYDGSGIAPGAGKSNRTITFETTGRPYVYDAWTGTQSPLMQYSQTTNTTTIPLALAPNQTVIIAFKKDASTQPPYVQQTTGGKVKTSYNESTEQVVFYSESDGPTTVTLSDGTNLTLPGSLENSTLGGWNLTIESWSPPTNLSDVEGTVKTNSTYDITSPLQAWRNLELSDSLTNVSGRGYYSSSFTWPPQTSSLSSNSSSQPTGAILAFSHPIVHTAILFINGQQVPPLDITAPEADISPFLQAGLNQVTIVVSTTLANVLQPLLLDLKSAGITLSDTGTDIPPTSIVQGQDYGLIGEVVLKPYIGVGFQV